MKHLNLRLLITFAYIVTTALTTVQAQSLSTLWIKYEKESIDDMPVSAIKTLKQIQQKAEKEKKYGDLLLALVSEREQMAELSQDSVKAWEKRMEMRHAAWQRNNGVVAALYQASMSNSGKPDVDSLLASPDAKIYTKSGLAKTYKPFVTIGDDSKYFNHDLLSLIAMQTSQYKAIQRYYASVGNRAGACIAASLMPLRKDSIELDSLIRIYQDLPECGALAVRRMRTFSYKQKGEKLAWIDESLKRWPSWRGINEMYNERNEMTEPRFNARLDKQVANSDYSHTMYFSNVRNMNGIRVNIRSMARDKDGEWKVVNGESAQTRTFSHNFKAHNEYETWSDSVVIGRLPLGVWKVTVSDIDGKVPQSNTQLHITDMRVIEQGLPQNKRRYVIVNNVTGHPVSGATLHLQSRRNRDSDPLDEKTFVSDENGECIISTNEGVQTYATKGDDIGMPMEYLYANYYSNSASEFNAITDLYSDRSIYRPGQTVHVGVICHTLREGKYTEVLAGRKLKVRLRNADYKDVESKDAVTDEYGTATVDFVLPEDGKNGLYSIVASNKVINIRVEEYKRPTYEVKLDEPDNSYKVGDTITLHGSARMYSGVPVANARVAYKVRRNTPWWWRYWRSYYDYDDDGGDDILLKDTVYTQADGTFTTRMPMTIPNSAVNSKHCCYYSIETVVDVTDIAGEAHTATLSLPVSNRATFFGLNMEKKILADTTISITFTRLNNIGREVDGAVSMTLDGTSMPDAKANKPYTLPRNIASGRHQLVAICENDTISHDFVVFRKNDEKPMTYTHDWWYQSAEKFSENDQTAWIQVATSDNDVYAVYSLFSGDKILESGHLRMNNDVVTRTFRYKEEYGDGITYSIAWVKDDKMYSHSGSIKRALPSKKLKMQWTTFRDKLVPGQKEQWTLNIKNPDGTPAKAQLMAVLYDKSLDAITKHAWTTNDPRVLFVPSVHWTTPVFRSTHISSSMPWDSKEIKTLDFSTINGKAQRRYRYGARMLYKNTRADAMPMMLESKAAIGAFDVNGVDESADVLYEEAVVERKTDAKTEGTETQDNSGLRTNFEETAFFMPQLITDHRGNATLRFTLPESVTTWKFMGLAHDKEMRTGLLTSEAVAQKQLMVQPRMPRFLRHGDKAEISATVANLSQKPLATTVTMILLDAKTEKELKTESKRVAIKAGETNAVTFPLDASQYSEDGIICRIMAEADAHKDGEQHLLPILPDTEEVITSQTWTLFQQGDSVIALAPLMPGDKAVSKPRLTVNYTDNPAWLMVDALRDIQTPDCGNAICLSTALYANVVTAAVKDSMLYSGAANVIAQLKSLQHTDGSFSWWQGMSGSRYMTMAVAKTLARMMMLAENSKAASSWKPAVNNMFQSAMRYMAKEMADDVEQMKKNKKEGYNPWLSSTELDWLYTLTISNMDGGATANYLLKLVEKDTKNDDMATKAVAAVVMNKNRRAKDARTFVESIKQHTVFRADVGRYFDSYRAAYSWCDYRIPTQTMCIEAMNSVTPQDCQTINDMKRWLLSSKRTQNWGNPYNAVNAVHAFFGGSISALQPGKQATLLVDGKQLDTTTKNERMALISGETTELSAAPELTVKKQSEGESWLSAYVTSRQKTTDISNHESGITIKRELFRTTGNRKATPLQANEPLKIGDKIIVRITVTADRDYDFVTVTDNRAACLEPTSQLSGYRNGCYQELKDKLTAYHYDKLSKGTHTIETQYYVERNGTYVSGSATAVCAYADEFRGTTGAYSVNVK